MGIYVNPVNANFRFSLNSPIYVDKTMLIAEMNRLMNTEKRKSSRYRHCTCILC